MSDKPKTPETFGQNPNPSLPGRGDGKLEKSAVKLADPELTSQEGDRIAQIRKRITLSMEDFSISADPPDSQPGAIIAPRAMIIVRDSFEETIQAQFSTVVGKLNLAPEEKEKLKRVLASYDEAVATARELDPNVQVPSKDQVMAHILAFGKQRLEKVATILSKPGLIIEPNKSLVEMKDAMNENCHYDSQQEAYFAKDYEWSGRPEKVHVSIMEMYQKPAAVSGQKRGLQSAEHQLRMYEKYFSDNGLHLASDRQFTAGLQQSLRAYKRARKKGEPNPEKYILDLHDQPETPVTMLSQEQNTAGSKIAIGSFSPLHNRVNLRWLSPEGREYFLRARGAVRVM